MEERLYGGNFLGVIEDPDPQRSPCCSPLTVRGGEMAASVRAVQATVEKEDSGPPSPSGRDGPGSGHHMLDVVVQTSQEVEKLLVQHGCFLLQEGLWRWDLWLNLAQAFPLYHLESMLSFSHVSVFLTSPRSCLSLSFDLLLLLLPQ